MSNTSKNQWKIAVDVGGTFTDCLGVDPAGNLHKTKLVGGGRLHGKNCEFLGDQKIRLQHAALQEVRGFYNGWILKTQQGAFRVIDSIGSTLQLASAPEEKKAQKEEKAQKEKAEQTEKNYNADWSLNPTLPEPVIAVQTLLGKALSAELPPMELRLGTTLTTNALLEEKTSPCALITTAGLEDLVRIGDQTRPDLFQLDFAKHKILPSEIFTVSERMDASGNILAPLDEAEALEILQKIKAKGYKSVAISLAHGYRNPSHENKLRELASGFDQVSIGSALCRQQNLLLRTQTALLDAAVMPLLDSWLEKIFTALPTASILLMSSSGSLRPRGDFQGLDSILSGPAGGMRAACDLHSHGNKKDWLAFDMGGTSTDLSRGNGQNMDFCQKSTIPSGKNQLEVQGRTLNIETIAAGGGSICSFKNGEWRVGPDSAAAVPGPACYGNGGPLTLTDTSFFLGELIAGDFPFSLDLHATETELRKIQQQIQRETGETFSLREIAKGFQKVGRTLMQMAIEKITIKKGTHPKKHSLVAMGGAAGQHVCSLADLLEMDQILLHPHASFMSALGILMAPREWIKAIPIQAVLKQKAVNEDLRKTCDRLVAEIEAKAKDQFRGSDTSLFNFQKQIEWELRYQGQEDTLPLADSSDLVRDFHNKHHSLFGFSLESRKIELRGLRVSLIEATGNYPIIQQEDQDSSPIQTATGPQGSSNKEGDSSQAPRLRSVREGLAGPCLVRLAGSCIVLEKGWQVSLQNGCVVLNRISPAVCTERSTTAADSVFRHHLVRIADQMGSVLQRSAVSVNIRERRDFSCAVFDPEGHLVVNAPHVPVHLGAMGEMVRTLSQKFPNVGPEQCLVSNHPFAGGSHLPDITVVTPVLVKGTRFFVASRAHHADIGGIAPGSMPAHSNTLAEEGVLLDGLLLEPEKDPELEKFVQILRSSPYPARNPQENVADLQAQIAAGHFGQKLLVKLCLDVGTEQVRNQMQRMQQLAYNAAKELSLQAGRFEDRMDNGKTLRLDLSKKEGRLCFDFTGTDDQCSGNLNANPSIVRAAVLYCLRCLLGEGVPLNEGILGAVTILTRPGSLLNPLPTSQNEFPAVVGGNVEVSQRLVDLIFGATGTAAASQGTMNNITFAETGGKTYYETLGGGCGAGPDFDGQDATHSHMTNTRMTDIEVLEEKFSVRVEKLGIARQSGGAGKHRGGNGLTRTLEFLKPMYLGLLTNRRTERPWGLMGGQSGTSGKNLLILPEGEQVKLDSGCHRKVEAGTKLVMQTPGGGGYGSS